MKFTTKKFSSAASLAIIATLALSACSGSQAEESGDGAASGEVPTITTSFAAPRSTPGLYLEPVAEALGFFAENGVDVEYVVSPAGGSLVAAGQADLVSYDIPTLINENLASDGAGLVSIFNAGPGGSAAFVTMPDSDVTSFCDLGGKVVGTYSPGATGVPFFKAAAAECGLDPDNDIELVVVPPGPGIGEALSSGSVDLFVAHYALEAQLEAELGTDLNRIELPESLSNSQAVAMSVRPEDVTEKRDAFVAYTRSLIQARAFAFANPQAAAVIMVDSFPELVAPGTPREDTVAAVTMQIEAALQTTTVPEGVGLEPPLNGYQWAAQWEPFANDTFGEGFSALSGDFEQFFTNDIVEAAYEGLDLSAVEALAKSDEWMNAS